MPSAALALLRAQAVGNTAAGPIAHGNCAQCIKPCMLGAATSAGDLAQALATQIMRECAAIVQSVARMNQQDGAADLPLGSHVAGVAAGA